MSAPVATADRRASSGVRIEFDRVSRSFGRRVLALDDVSLVVEPGEIVALLGPSGSGKSTLLRICAGLEAPSSGDVRFDGVSQLGVEPHLRRVSMVFQNFALYPHLSALDNLVIALRHGRGLPRATARARALDTLRALKIDDLADRRPAQMSGGQKQRVAIGRALATEARVVLLDEPMSGLDAKLRVELRIDIVARLRELGSTALFVTHDQAEAMAVGDRIALMRAGALDQVGTPDEIYDRPATRFVAGFVGGPPMNIRDGRYEGGLLRGLDGDDFAVPAPPGAAAVGVRPEHLTVAETGPGARAGGPATPDPAAGPTVGLRLVGDVTVSERLGADRALFVRLSSGDIVAARLAAHDAPPAGRVTLSAPTRALSFFDAGGNAIQVV